MGKNIVVISAVNFTTGGPFTVLKNVLTATKDRAECKFIALVHSSAELMELFLFVQQQWLKKEFEKKYKLKNVVVSRPEDICPFESDGLVRNNNKKDVRIFYPAVPRIFKNFEVIIRAAQILQDKNIHFYLTFDGTENKYAKRIYKLASELKNVHFL
ncbi:glycosyltransferase family 1 protein, partial [Escherichia coli]|nr:glycosyltransferase family 1 protein [Escherichia coli]